MPLELWSTAEQVRQSRLQAISQAAATEETALEVTGKFLDFVLNYRSDDANLALLPLLKVKLNKLPPIKQESLSMTVVNSYGLLLNACLGRLHLLS